MAINFGILAQDQPKSGIVAALPNQPQNDGIGGLLSSLAKIGTSVMGNQNVSNGSTSINPNSPGGSTLGYTNNAVGLNPGGNDIRPLLEQQVSGAFAHGGETNPTSIIFHDTAGPTLESAEETLKQRGLSYNYIIDKDGTVKTLVPAGIKAFHAKGYNDNTVGVSFVGGGGFGDTTPEQQASAVKLSQQLKQQFPQITSFAGHRDRTNAGKPDPEGFDYSGFEKASGLKFEAGAGSERYDYSNLRDTSPGKVTQVIPNLADTKSSVPNAHPDLEHTVNGIVGVESGGDYNAVGKATKTGDRAYGYSQIMGSNIPSWTHEALGHPLTPQQYLNDPEAQRKTTEYQVNKMLNQYGNPDDVASAWFTGKPLDRVKGNPKDAYGTSNSEYQKKFNQGYLKSKQISENQSVSHMPVKESGQYPSGIPVVDNPTYIQRASGNTTLASLTRGIPTVPVVPGRAFDKNVRLQDLTPEERQQIIQRNQGINWELLTKNA